MAAFGEVRLEKCVAGFLLFFTKRPSVLLLSKCIYYLYVLKSGPEIWGIKGPWGLLKTITKTSQNVENLHLEHSYKEIQDALALEKIWAEQGVLPKIGTCIKQYSETQPESFNSMNR